MTRDWKEWHRQYQESGSPLERRLAVVQRCIRDALAALPPGRIRALSICAGDGRDLLGALAGHSRAGDVEGRLVELDPELAAAARRAAPPSVEVRCADASHSDNYEGAVPAELVLACGVFGNVSDADVERTVRALSSLCAPAARVIWTRHRRAPDLTVAIRRWFAQSGFEEIEFVAPPEFMFSVGVHRLTAPLKSWAPHQRWFSFVEDGRSGG